MNKLVKPLAVGLVFCNVCVEHIYLLSMSLCKYCSMFVDVNATCTKYHCMYKFIIIYLFFIFRECGERPFCETVFLFDACFECVFLTFLLHLLYLLDIRLNGLCTIWFVWMVTLRINWA